MYFDFDSDYFTDRQEVLNRLQLVTVPAGLQPQLSPWSPIGGARSLPRRRTQVPERTQSYCRCALLRK